MKLRAALPLALCASLLAVGSAHAGCTPLVVDADRDTGVPVGDPGLAYTFLGKDIPGLDIVSADLTSDAKSFNVVLRLAGDMSADASATTGQMVHATFRVGLSLYEIHSFRSAYFSQHVLMRNVTGGSNPEGVVTPSWSKDGRTMTLSMSAASFASTGGRLPTRGTAVTDTFVATGYSLAAVSTYSYVDEAATEKTYRAGAKAC